jgi:hypothetical protein
MDITSYITNNALVLIPILYLLGMLIKGIEKIDNRYIPLILLVAGVGGAVGIMGFSVNSVIQGILITGATVYTDQVIKLNIKKE